MLAQFFGWAVSDLAAEHRRKLALWMNSHHRKEALEQISSDLKLKFLEFMKLYGKTGFPPELYVSTKGGAKTSSTSFKETKGTTCGTMGRSTTSFKEDEIQDDLDVLSSSSSSDESEGQDISDLQLGPLELKEEEQRSSRSIDETESSGPSEIAALEDLMVEEPEGDGPPKKRGYGCTGMKGVSRRIDTKNGTVSYQARPVFFLGILVQPLDPYRSARGEMCRDISGTHLLCHDVLSTWATPESAGGIPQIFSLAIKAWPFWFILPLV